MSRAIRNATVNGVTRPLNEWSKLYGVPVRLIQTRMSRKWSAKRAVMTPPSTHGGYRAPSVGTATPPQHDPVEAAIAALRERVVIRL